MTSRLFLLLIVLMTCSNIKANVACPKLDSLPEVFVKGKKIGFSKLLKDCYSNFTTITPKGFKQEFTGQSTLTKNGKVQFDFEGFCLFDFTNYLNYNFILLAQDSKLTNYIEKSKNENLTLYPFEIFKKLDLNELKDIVKSQKYQFNLVVENNEKVEIAFSPKYPIFQKQNEITTLNNLNELELADSKRFYYSGTFTINKIDLAFEKIQIQLLKSNKNTTVSLIKNFKAADKYLILFDKIEMLFKKRNNVYYISTLDYISEWTQIDLGQSNDLGRFKLKEHFVHVEKSNKVYNSNKYDLYTISHK
jgi:hypothetical protein